MASELEIRVFRSETTLCLAAEGRITGESAALLQRAGAVHFSSRLDQVALDMRDVEFIDSGGLGALVGLKIRCTKEKTQFMVLCPSPTVAEVLNISRLTSVFPVFYGDDGKRRLDALEKSEYELEPIRSSDQPAGYSAGTGDSERPSNQTNAEQVDHMSRQAVDLIRQGEYSQAVEIYQKILEIDPESIMALNNLAVIYEKRPLWTRKAIETWERVLTLSQKLDDVKHRQRAERRLAQLRTGMEPED